MTQQWCLHRNKYGKPEFWQQHSLLRQCGYMCHNPKPGGGGQSPGRKLTKISKKKAQKGLNLKGEMGDSSSFCLACTD
jgi:hypothetical protein